MSATPLVLHVWPGRWDLLSIDTTCLEAILYLQLAFPGRFSLVETANSDLSPNGQLPFLTHAQLVVSPLPSIVSYLSSLNPSLVAPVDPENDDEITPDPDLDAGLNVLHLSQRTAWRAYVEAQLGDLVTHSFFVLEPNYQAFTHGLLASMLPVPQRYYVPRRIRESHKPRLEAVGLWQVASELEAEDRDAAHNRKGEDKETKIRRAFGQAKLTEKAIRVFDILARLLNEQSFIFDNRLTSIDLALASRILLLMKAPLPNPALKDILISSYPSLTSHASRIHALASPTSNPAPPILAPSHVNPLGVFKSSLAHLTRRSADESEEAKRFRRYRWGWIALAVAGAVGYLATQGLMIVIPVVVERDGQETEGDFEEVVEDEDEDLLDDMEMDEEEL